MRYNQILVLASLFIYGCEKKDPLIVNEEELITSVNYVLSSAGGGLPITLKFSDIDGDGGKAPIITGGTLKANTTYTGKLQVLNESTSPIIDIGTEILAEANDHQFFYSLNTKNIKIIYTDADKNGKPLGLSSELKTGAAESGTLKITLKHKPNKTAVGVMDGLIGNAGGETDVEVNFPIRVQ